MKIEKTHVFQSIPSKEKVTSGNTNGSDSFKSVFQEQILSTPTQAVIQTGQIPPGMGIQFDETVNDLKDTTRATSRLIDALDHYRDSLGDPKQSLRSVAQSVDEMTRTLETLDRLVEKLPDQTPLHPIVDDVRSLVKGEANRFYSGYYVDP